MHEISLSPVAACRSSHVQYDGVHLSLIACVVRPSGRTRTGRIDGNLLKPSRGGYKPNVFIHGVPDC